MRSVPQADFAATTPWAGVQGKPPAFDPAAHASTHGPEGGDKVALAIGQILGLVEALAAKVNRTVTVNGHPLTQNVVVSKADVGLSNVDNYSYEEMNALEGTLENKTLLAPIVDGGEIRHLTVLGVMSDGSGAFDVILSSTSVMTDDRTLYLNLGDADRILTLGGNFTTAGGHITLNAVSATSVSLPTSGTLLTADAVSGVYNVLGLPSAAAYPGRTVYCVNGNAGSPCAAISNGTDWRVIAIGGVVS